MKKSYKTTKTKKLLLCSMMIAISTVLSLVSELIPFLHLPFGGSFTLASMLPVILCGYMFGALYGFGSAITYAIVQLLISFRTVSAFFLPESDGYLGNFMSALLICLIDYILAYTMLGFGFLFRKNESKTVGLVLGVITAIALRYAAHIVSGAIFYGAWAEWFFTQEGFYSFGKALVKTLDKRILSIVYSAFYNGLYMIPEMIITALVAIPVSKIKTVKKYN